MYVEAPTNVEFLRLHKTTQKKLPFYHPRRCIAIEINFGDGTAETSLLGSWKHTWSYLYWRHYLSGLKNYWWTTTDLWNATKNLTVTFIAPTNLEVFTPVTEITFLHHGKPKPIPLNIFQVYFETIQQQLLSILWKVMLLPTRSTIHRYILVKKVVALSGGIATTYLQFKLKYFCDPHIITIRFESPTLILQLYSILTTPSLIPILLGCRKYQRQEK
jgi:hypothetical protein